MINSNDGFTTHLEKGNLSAAFFDLDDTLLDMHTMKSFASYLGEEGIVRPEDVIEMLNAVNTAVKEGKKREQTNEIFFKIFRGMKESEYIEFGKKWWKKADKRFNKPVFNEYLKLKESGAHVVAISGSYSCCVKAISEDIGMTAGYGSEPEIVNSVLTGKVKLPLVGERKKLQLINYLASHPELAGYTLAYGDHSSDFPMLTAVSMANFVKVKSYDSEALNYAKSKKWRVIEVTKRY
ncbi:HAD-IB family phosphatase [Klebsiella michiganensis]|uniref:HAD-IB family phosphatase n=1 Tax=Klebsiella michiganensis TaxID=1134687 RepID=A0A6P1V7Q8_9ENTR|nr:HAD-IB family phosphatase [Klebsiella michiganensis]QHS50142.1 HAD-IB family phosphatase [Klebsiella michiganensis]HDX8940943.1 HAD-IB family phosphatase [Klebsiella michiganensis]